MPKLLALPFTHCFLQFRSRGLSLRSGLVFAFLIIPVFLHAQQNAGSIYPGVSFTNQSPDTLFFLTKQKIEVLMDRQEISTALIGNLSIRNAITDSLLKLKSIEANAWYNSLLENDKLLEESEIRLIQEKEKFRKRTKIWFGVGALGGFIIGVVL